MTKGMGATMEQPTRAQVLKLSDDIQKLILSDKMQKALVEASGEPELLKRAKADPRAFFEKRGVSLPKSYTAQALRNGDHLRNRLWNCGWSESLRASVRDD
jgi:hypothetical protein